MKILLFVAAVLAIACGPAPAGHASQAPEVIVVGTGPEAQPDWQSVATAARLPPLRVCLYEVSDDARAEVERGVLAWADVLRPWRDLELADGTCNVTIYEVGAHAMVCADEMAAGCTTQIGGLDEENPSLEIFLYRGNYESYAAGATMHELGHLLGLTHHDGGLMQAGWTPAMRAAEWSAPDVETIARLSVRLGVDL